ncbi:ABC transporter substrate-binding protein [Acidaminobacterium chupaoyuni]
MRNRKLRVLSLILATMMLVGMLAGCSSKGSSDKNSDKTTGDSSKGTAKDTLIVATMSETPSVHYADHNATAGSYVNALTYDTLFRSDKDLKPQPHLVESYENLSDTVWQFKLKSGIKFHNGETMTANDVKASLEKAKTYPEVSLYNDSISSVEVVDDLTFKITTPAPSAILLNNLCHHGNAIVPKSLIDSNNDFGKNPIGSGPYVFKNWTLGDSLEFEAFADYFDGAPAIKKIVWKTIPEGSSRTIAMEAGEVDFVIEVEAMDADRLKENSDVTVYEFNSTEENWLMLNNEKPGLDNVLVRKAINAAIDKDSVVTVAMNGQGKPALSACPANLLGASDENTDKYDVEKAKKYLADSKVDPASVKLSIICSNDWKKRAGEVIQANLKEVGITADIESMDLATYLSTTAEGNYTAAIGGYTASDMVSYMVGVYHSKSINASNKTRVNDAKVDELIDKAAATIDEGEREKILKECTARLNDLCTQAPLFQGVVMRAYNKNLEGVLITNSGDMYFDKAKWAA